MSVTLAVLTVWVTMAAGVLKASVFKDAWDRQCREHYWPERLRSGRALVLMLIMAPVGFFVALRYARRMRKNPLPTPEWAVQMLADLESTTGSLKKLNESLRRMSASLDESIAIVDTAIEAISEPPHPEER